jgi:proline iminopeptidase
MSTVIDDTGTVSAGEFDLRYRIEGTGIPTIVVGCSVYYPRVFSQNIRKYLKLVFVDHRGFAPLVGPVDMSTFEFDIMLDDIERVRQTLGLGKIMVIGHSGHSFMALEYAKKYPENVSQVVMIGISPSLSEENIKAADQYWLDSVSPERKTALEENIRNLPDEQLAALSPEQQFVKSYVRKGPRIWHNFLYDSSPLWEGTGVNMDIFTYVWGTVFRDIDITRGLETFDKPVFLGLGRYDFLVAPPSSWDPVRPKFKNLTVRVFERSGHTPQYEEPELFDEELLRWLLQS